MNNYTKNQLLRVGRVLKNIGLTKEQTGGILSMLETEEMADELMTQLEQKDFNLTPQETMNLFAQIVKNHHS